MEDINGESVIFFKEFRGMTWLYYLKIFKNFLRYLKNFKIFKKIFLLNYNYALFEWL